MSDFYWILLSRLTTSNSAAGAYLGDVFSISSDCCEHYLTKDFNITVYAYISQVFGSSVETRSKELGVVNFKQIDHTYSQGFI